MKPTALTLLLAALALAAAVPAAATSYVPVSDQDLLRQAPLVVEARVAAVAAAPSERPATDYTLEIDAVLKGQAGGTLVLRVPGGERADGLRLYIWGAPQLVAGDRGLFFLRPAADHTHRSLHLMLGTFQRVRVDGTALAARNLEGVAEVRPDGTLVEAGERQGRLYDRFRDWIVERAAGRPAAADYFVTLSAEQERQVHEQFTQLTIQGVPTRWVEFDSNRTVTWQMHQSGQAGVPGGGAAELQRALAAWNDEPKTPLRLVWGGTTSASAGFSSPDGKQVVLFDDPNSDIDAGPFVCGEGGVLAIGGPWGDPSRRMTFNGQQFIEILEAEVVMNRGLECFFLFSPDPSRAAEEIFGHELGHTLGLGHSCGDGRSGSCAEPAKREALMRAFVHNDGRGARLSSDDEAGLHFLYQRAGGSGPAAPGKPVLAFAGDAVTLGWSDNSNDEDGFRIYRGVDDSALELHATLPADATTTVDGAVEPGRTYTYLVASFHAGGESRSGRSSISIPQIEPVTATLAPTSTTLTGAAVAFSAQVSGPVVRTEWRFGGDGRGFAELPCAPGVFCASHLFTTPGVYTVTVTAIGDRGQTATTSAEVTVDGGPVSLVTRRSFLQSVLFAPRGATDVFESDLWLLNEGSAAALVEARFVPRGAGDPQAPSSRVTVLPGQMVRVPNLVGSLFDLERSQGSVLLTTMGLGGQPPRVRAISRSFVELAGAGSFGQLVPEDPEATWSAAEKLVTGILEDDAFIATLLAVNVDATPGAVTVDLFDATGAFAGRGTLALDGLSMRFQTLGALVPAAAGRPSPFTARFSSGGTRFLASATLLELGSEDQIFLPARDLAPTSALVVPRVVHSRGLFDTFLVSQLAVLNPATTATTLTIELLERGADNSAPRAVTRTLGAGAILHVEDVFADLFGLTGDNLAGALRITYANAQGIAPRALSYALARNADGKRFGMLVDSRPLSDGALRSGEYVAHQDALFRASYGAVSLSPGSSLVRVTLKDAAGATLATAELGLKPYQHLERNLAGIFSGLGEGSNWRVETEVLIGGPVLTYVANINASGDVFFVPGKALE
ncbi:MAG TPA: PKD domain-containing protein [Thermoanaerobaculia bacterium]|nr:PKD domain-containing protein [Thermoanaerobaculia bacterium]